MLYIVATDSIMYAHIIHIMLIVFGYIVL